MSNKYAVGEEPFAAARSAGSRVRELRKARGWTQLDTAERLRMTGEAYARIERGASLPSLRTLMRICSLFGCTPDYLLLPDPPESGIREKVETSDVNRARRLWAEIRGLDPDLMDLVERLVHVLATLRH